MPQSRSLKLAEGERLIFIDYPEANVTINDMLSPAYWAHVAKSLKAGCRIEAVAADGSWFVELYVIRADRTWAQTALMREVKLSSLKIDIEKHEDFMVKFGTAQTKFRVIRKSDKQVIKEGLSTAQEAISWLDNYKKALTS